MQLRDDQGRLLPAIALAGEIPDQIRIGIGWAIHHPDGVRVRRDVSGYYRVHKEGVGFVSPEIIMPVLRAMLVMGMLNPAPDDPNEAVGNPDFLKERPDWRPYIPDPVRIRQQARK